MEPVAPVLLAGRWVVLEPLAAVHRDGLRAITGAPLFRFLPDNPHDFDRWWASAENSLDPLFFAAVVGEQALGRAAIQRIDLTNAVAEVGHILWGPGLRRTPAATEAVFLLVDHLFMLGARRVEWKCDDRNEDSKAAALRFGFTAEGVFRQHMIVKGENRDTAWFSLLDHEWPARRQALVEWLHPSNFDANARQVTRLAGRRNS